MSVDVSRKEAIAVVTLNKPTKMNALDLAMWKALANVMAQLDAEDDLRCVIVTGAGGNFAAGADISAFATERATTALARSYGEAEVAGVNAVSQIRHPTVAAIEGACVGGGLEIASACDIRICGENSRFGVPINRLGLTMSHEEIRFFVRTVGRSAALEILLEGRVFGTEDAYRLGLVQRVVQDAEVRSEAVATAHRISSGAPLVNRWHKQFIRRMDDPTPLSDAERAEGYAAFDTEDFKAGYRAFLNKERPEFQGK